MGILSASITLHRKSIMDNPAVFNEKVFKIVNDSFEDVEISDLPKLVKSLNTAGIFVAKDDIYLKAKQTHVRNTNNDDIAVFNDDGSLNANLINAKQIVADGLQASSIDADGIDAKYANIKNLVVTNCRVDGVLASPFVIENYLYEWSDGIEYYAAKAHDNIIYNNGEHALYWDTSCSGRTIYLVHHESVGGVVMHVNRMPTAGTIERKAYVPGKYLNASLDKASKDNERCAYLIKTADGAKYGVVQIAGLVARRIVPFVEEGATLGQAERFGLIRFGSRLDVYLPHS